MVPLEVRTASSTLQNSQMAIQQLTTIDVEWH